MKDFTVRRYLFSELSPEAQAKAIEKAQEFNYETMDNEQISEPMLVELQELLTGEQGTGDFPPSLKLLDWDVSYSQGSHIGIDGELTKDLAPAQPWNENVSKIELSWHHNRGQQITCYDLEGEETDTPDDVKEMIRTLQNELMTTGRAEMDYLGSEEYAREYLHEAERMADDSDGFLEDGTYAPVLGQV